MTKTVRHFQAVESDHFQVSSAVSGLPLATHSRLAIAMIVDLAIIAAPTIAIRNPITPIAVLVAAVLYRVSRDWQTARWKGESVLVLRRAVAVLIVLVGAVAGQAWKHSHPKHLQSLG